MSDESTRPISQGETRPQRDNRPSGFTIGVGSLRRAVGGWDGFIGLGILVSLTVLAVVGPLVYHVDPNAIDSTRVLGPPSTAHPFGSDEFGRDVLSRTIAALRVSLAVAAGAVGLAFAAGTAVGLVSGYVGSKTDAILMRGVDLVLAFPAMLLAIGLLAIVGPGNGVVMLAIAIIYFPIFARVVRTSVRLVRRQPYVLATQARGASGFRVAVRHVLPNAIGPAVSQAALLMAFAVQLLAALSFIGLGVQRPTAELGVMLYSGRDVLALAPWVVVAPAIALVIIVLGFILLGNGLAVRISGTLVR